MNEDIIEQVRKITSEIFNVELEDVHLESSPKTIANWDSMQHLNLVLALEQNFLIEFIPEEITQMINVKSVVQIVERKIAPG
jgi:acyl carrier protein